MHYADRRTPLHASTTTATGHDLDAALDAIAAATGEGEGEPCLIRFVLRSFLRSAAYANAGRIDGSVREFQASLSAAIASGAFRKTFALSDDDVRALIGA